MGNPTPAVVDEMFERIGLSTPFGDTYGEYLLSNGWEAEKTSGSAIRTSRSLISANVERRNDAVHGLGRIVFYDGEIADLCVKFESIGKGLFASVNAQF